MRWLLIKFIHHTDFGPLFLIKRDTKMILKSRNAYPKELIIEALQAGFYEQPTKERDQWLKSNFNISYVTFYRKLKKYNIKVVFED